MKSPEQLSHQINLFVKNNVSKLFPTGQAVTDAEKALVTEATTLLHNFHENSLLLDEYQAHSQGFGRLLGSLVGSYAASGLELVRLVDSGSVYNMGLTQAMVFNCALLGDVYETRLRNKAAAVYQSLPNNVRTTLNTFAPDSTQKDELGSLQRTLAGLRSAKLDHQTFFTDVQTEQLEPNTLEAALNQIKLQQLMAHLRKVVTQQEVKLAQVKHELFGRQLAVQGAVAGSDLLAAIGYPVSAHTRASTIVLAHVTSPRVPQIARTLGVSYPDTQEAAERLIKAKKAIIEHTCSTNTQAIVDKALAAHPVPLTHGTQAPLTTLRRLSEGQADSLTQQHEGATVPTPRRLSLK